MSPVGCANAGVAGGSTGSNANCVTEQAMFPSEQKELVGGGTEVRSALHGGPYAAFDHLRLRAITAPLLVYSMTLSASATSVGGTESPSCLAVLRLRDNSNLVT